MIVTIYKSNLWQLQYNKNNFLLKLFRNGSTCVYNKELKCDLLIVGGGTGGCSTAARFCRHDRNLKVVIIEPSIIHYYQPMFTLIGGGVRKVSQSVRLMKEVLPPAADWLNTRVQWFDPDNNCVYTYNGNIIHYKYMVVSCGMELNYQSIPGLVDALAMENSNVCSIFSPEYAEKTFKVIQNLRSGNAIFSFPNSPVKCAGAPLKICFLAEHYTRLNNRRDSIKFMYKTSQPVIFGVKYYADNLFSACCKRKIDIGFRKELIAIKPDKKEAVFRNLDKTFEVETINYSMLHVTPAMNTPTELKNTTCLVDKNGFLNVDKCTLQHVKYKNIFGLGDCTNLPTSKTAAAIGSQGTVLFRNLSRVMKHRPVDKVYTGYTSCPLITGYGTLILAEFDYEHNPIETFPIDQRKERILPYYMKLFVLPHVYWWCMKGFWNGPSVFRKICHLGLSHD